MEERLIGVGGGGNLYALSCLYICANASETVSYGGLSRGIELSLINEW
jgi:hypothetical protein